MALPLLMAIVILMDSYSGILGQSALTWLNTQIYNINLLYIMPLMSIIVCTNFTAKEIEDRSLGLYIYRINNRRVIYKAKILSHLLFTALVFLSVSILLIALYYGMVVRNTVVASGDFGLDIHLGGNMVVYTILFLYNVVIIPSVTVCLGVFFKPTPTIGLVASLVIISHYLHEFTKFVKYLNPWGYVAEIVTPIISVGEITIKNSQAFTYLLLSLILAVIIAIGTYAIGAGKFIRRDL